MRVSTDKDDPGYGPDIFRVKVWLDDVPQKACVTADEEQGYIERCMSGPDGKYFTEDGMNIAIERLYGKVRIKREDVPSVDGQHNR